MSSGAPVRNARQQAGRLGKDESDDDDDDDHNDDDDVG